MTASPTRVSLVLSSPSSYWVNPFRATIFRVPLESHSSLTRVTLCWQLLGQFIRNAMNASLARVSARVEFAQQLLGRAKTTWEILCCCIHWLTHLFHLCENKIIWNFVRSLKLLLSGASVLLLQVRMFCVSVTIIVCVATANMWEPRLPLGLFQCPR